ncbi:hypothetical protein [Streptomyces sp. Root264]|uniref:hypothetical protein n=1 Tax=Streptomyces sp. Root264 TaxID=1736503 RepID=UPI001F5BDF3A|nr:hypothetical protein [Streptomyces sp. Root264]
MSAYAAPVTERNTGFIMYVSWENHDTCAGPLAVIETEQLADRVTIVGRDGTMLYANEFTLEGRWRNCPAADRVVRAERARPWTAPETAVFRRDLARTDRRLHTELADEDRRLAVQRDSERAAAWSEPVPRTAQPTATPPGSPITGCRPVSTVDLRRTDHSDGPGGRHPGTTRAPCTAWAGPGRASCWPPGWSGAR